MPVRPIWRLYCDVARCAAKNKRVYVKADDAVEKGIRDGWQVTDAGYTTCPFHSGNGVRKDGVMGDYVRKYTMRNNYTPVPQPDTLTEPPPF